MLPLSGVVKSAAVICNVLSSSKHHVVRVVDLSDRTNLSLSYIEHIVGYLRRARLIAGVRGPGGGYTLMRSVTLLDLVEALETNKRRKTPERAWAELNQVEESFRTWASSVSVAQCRTPEKSAA